MKRRGILFRKTLNTAIKLCSVFCVTAAVAVLVWILYTVLRSGLQAFNWSFFAESTKPYGVEDGGIANALLGTLFITAGAVIMSVPPGLFGGIYLSEFDRDSRLSRTIRFSANVMMGIPSILCGLFVYALLVCNTKHFSGFAGSLALAVIMFPVVLRTSEDMLRMVPNSLRESALALGTPHWAAVFTIVCRAAKNGLLTGVLLAIARVGGETAPLLFTALWSDDWPFSFFSEPTANLTVTINEYATNSPFEVMHTRAWGAALIICIAILALNIFCRSILNYKRGN
ncbi:MAG: phosphate ABC transporter permease PstA [Victivallaceae bacterium]|nr:phosphate ABC transporter permease PstA [Victivallaceae bacterium]